MSNQISPRLACGILTVFGLATLWMGGGDLYQEYIIWKSWPTVDAEVTSAQGSEHVEYKSGKYGGGNTLVYTNEIGFRYAVNGHEYAARSSVTWTKGDSIARTFRPGTRHPIRYNPANPTDIRFTGYHLRSPLFYVVVGIIIVALGVAVLLGYIRM